MGDLEKKVHTLEDKNTPLNSEDKISKKSSSNASKPNNVLKTKICSYFYNYGFCKFGKNCKYNHLRKRNDNTIKSASNKNTRILRNVNETVNKEQNCSLEVTRVQILFKPENEDQFSVENESALQQPVSLCSGSPSNLDLSSSKRTPHKTYSNSHKSLKVHYKPVCFYFKRGRCYNGDNCKYYHPKQSNIVISHPKTTNVNVPVENDPDTLIENKDNSSSFLENTEDKNLTLQCSTVNKPHVIKKDIHVHDLSSLTESGIAQLRCTEINQMKKRFPQFETVMENQTFSFVFEPSDPDWAFDVKFLNFKVNFPEKYPIEKLDIKVVQHTENFPLLLIKFLNTAISEWVNKKFEENKSSDKTELVFRPFLKWFDKNIEDLFISGLKKVKRDLKAKEDGIEFVPAENLFPASKDSHSEELIDSKQNNSELQKQIAVPSIKISEPLVKNNYQPPYYGGNNGMKIIFSGLELTEGAAALLCTKISVTLQCARCKTLFNQKSAPRKSNSHLCSKCSKNMGFTFDPCTAHQFSSVLGTLHLLECIAVDVNLVECHFLVDCLNCSKQVAVDGIHYGQKHKMWCTFCNEKMLISIECVKFQALKLAAVPDAKYIPAKKTERKVKDPIIKEGEHLPNFGACRHYKKSFRWLRFPCCGRLYPCDVCHDEKETDHEMKFASRMICGFCSKEQPYSRDKPCTSCSQSTTKKSSSHWEGGKGCRNKIQMSREDKHKYSGVFKTVSKKAQNVKQGKK